MSLVAEVPLLQIFDSELGDITWIKLLIAVLSVLCLCHALLEISIVLHVNVNHSIAFTNISKEWQHQRRHGNDKCQWQM